MATNSSVRFGYIKERAINAVSQLRRGEYRLFVKNIKLELDYRLDAISGKARHFSIIAGRTVRISALHAHRKVHILQRKLREAFDLPTDSLPPPTREQHFEVKLPDDLIPDSAYCNARKVIPPSFRPTVARLHRVTELQSVPEPLLGQLIALSHEVKPALAPHLSK